MEPGFLVGEWRGKKGKGGIGGKGGCSFFFFQGILGVEMENISKFCGRITSILALSVLLSLSLSLSLSFSEHVPLPFPSLQPGCDLSKKLVEICHSNGHSVVSSCGLSVPFRDDGFDVTINIAVLHHISTLERRQQVF